MRCRRKLVTGLQKYCTLTERERARTSKWQTWSRYVGKDINPCPKDQTMVVQHVASPLPTFCGSWQCVETTDNRASLRQHKNLHCTNNKWTMYTFILIYTQQDATLHSSFISGNYSACFGWYLHPSSGAHTNVSTASGTCQTVTAFQLLHDSDR